MTTETDTTHGPRPTQAAAGDPVETAFTVNGTPTTIRLPARVTLADALRDHLGLTGTHLGCEHGVCGMCTVLVDGAAARACLLLACQLDGAEIVTVEGLGKPDELHPLQESFGRHHALQCGFCTPGFLLSSYDLLTTRPEVTDDELPDELSGVLCRCTGYKNVLAAVADTRHTYPNGVPAPANCGRRALAGRAATATGGEDVDVQEGPARPEAPAAITLPEREPTVTVDVSHEIDAGAEQVWSVFTDVHRLARCLPGAELTDELGDGRYAGRARVAVGPIKLTFHGVAHVAETDRDAGRLRVLAQGQDTGGAQTQGEITLRCEDTGTGTRVRAQARLYLTGRIAQFGRSLAGDVSRRLFEQFASNVEHAATTGQAPTGPARAPGAAALIAHTVRDALARVWRRARERRSVR